MSAVVRDIEALVRAFVPGESVFLPGSAGEVPSLTAALGRPDAPALRITASFVPGINSAPVARAAGDGRFRNPFAVASRGAQAAGTFEHRPVSYGRYAAALRDERFDTLVLHVSAPDASGRVSLGPAVEFGPIVAARAKRLFAVVNPQLPAMPRSTTLSLDDFALVAGTDEPLRGYDVGAPSAKAEVIARKVASFVEDGAALQVGLGKVPDALLRMLGDRRGLRLHSGMLSDATRHLTEVGALDPTFRHASCVHVGTRDYYDWLRDRDGFAVLGCDESHSPAFLAGLSGLVAVNSALAVDLFGQADLETVGGRAISGVGGAADFARGASLAPGGLSILALPSVTAKGASRIVGRLAGIVSLTRQDVDVVVTEHGAADLRGLSVAERGERLVAVADPAHRAELADAWRRLLADL